MALCSRACNKRPCGVFAAESPQFTLKKRKTSSIDLQRGNYVAPAFEPSFHLTRSSLLTSSSSEDEDLNSDNDRSGYDLQQARAKRRASTRKLFASDNADVCRACSLYSDDEEVDAEQEVKNACSSQSNPVANNGHRSCSGNIALTNYSYRSSFGAAESPLGFPPPSSPQPTRIIESDQDLMSIVASPSSSLDHSNKFDKRARGRCFDYLVGSIDAAWARYCNATSSMEDLAFGCDIQASTTFRRKIDDVVEEEEEDDDEDDDEDEDDAYLSGSSNGTELTDYETEPFHSHKLPNSRPLCRERVSIFAFPVETSSAEAASFSSPSSSNSSSSAQLQVLKDRLTKAKYYLQDLVDSDHMGDIACFWKRWDMIKYATIELVEDDDDDEVVEVTIEDLEKGRAF